MHTPRSFSKAYAKEVLRRAHYDQGLIDEVMSQLPDPIDVDRDSSILLHSGRTPDALISRAGGSP